MQEVREHRTEGTGQNYCTQTGPTTLQKDRWSLHVPLFPHLKRWCLVCIAPTLSGVETKKKIQTSLCHFSINVSFMHMKLIKRFKPPCAISPSMQASCTPNMKVSTQILRPINFVHLANQTGGILHSPPTPTQGGSSSSTLVMTTSLI